MVFPGFISLGEYDSEIRPCAVQVGLMILCRDVSYESYKAHRRGPTPVEAAHFSEATRISFVAAERACFQSIASMLVHSVLLPESCH